MRRTTTPEAVRAVQKALLVNCLQYHDYRPLKHLVLEGRYPDGTRLRAISFWYVHSPNRWCHVAAGLDPFEQRAEVFLQVARIILGRLSVHAGGSVLARAPIRLAQPVDIDVLSKRRQCHLRHLARQLRYPLEFR